MDVRDSLTIGDFGRRSGLSVKALRLYDMSGLLPPAHIDASGYRRYTSGQLDRARRISLLRQLDMPLAVVAEVLAGTDEEALIRLDRWWAAQETSMVARRGTLGWLRDELTRSASAPPPYAVLRRDVPDVKVACIRAETDQQGLLDTFRQAEWEIRRHLDAAGARTTAEHWLIFHGHVTPDSEAPIEVCVPFTGTVEPVASMAIRLEAAHSQAYATVTREDCFYPRIMHAYTAVETHVAGSGLVTSGSIREVYLARWDDIADSDPFALVAQPVAD